jgi:hypothetical protein
MVIFWTANLPPFVVAFFVLDYETFVRVSLLYLGLVSIIALIAAFGSWWQSLRIEEHQQDDADVREVLDVVTKDERVPRLEMVGDE